MAYARVEFGNLGRGYQLDNITPAIIKDLVGEAVNIDDVGAVVTTEGNRPTVPAGASVAFVMAVEGNVIVNAGAVASQSVGKLVLAGNERALAVRPGQKLSFIELEGGSA